MTLAATARSAAIGSMLVLGACAAEREAGRDIVWESERVAPTAAPQEAASAPGLDADGCREYTQTIRIGDEEQQAYGRACLQADGSWRISPPPGAPAPAQGTPTAAQAVPAYPYHYAPPAFFGSAFFFSHRHHHHRHHRHHHHRGHRHSHHRR